MSSAHTRHAWGALWGLGLVLLLALPAHAGWWDDLDRGTSVRLNDIIAQPDAYRRKTVSFFCVFFRQDDAFNPLATPFNAERFSNVAVWTDGAPVWEQEAFKHYFPFLYVQRSHPQHRELVSLPTFTRIEVTGRVRAVLRSIPCIQVESFRLTGHRLGAHVVQSVMAGDRYAQAGDDELAFENYKRAFRADLPPSYGLLIRKRVADGLRRLGRFDDALAVEGGHILGGSDAPYPATDPDPPAAAPGFPAPGVPAPVADDLPGTPAGEAPAPLATDLPGQPAGRAPLTRDLPGQPAGRDPATTEPGPAFPPPSSPPPSAPISSDLPGRPMTEERAPSAAETPAPAPQSPRRLPGAPPRRMPRLSGVK